MARLFAALFAGLWVYRMLTEFITVQLERKRKSRFAKMDFGKEITKRKGTAMRGKLVVAIISTLLFAGCEHQPDIPVVGTGLKAHWYNTTIVRYEPHFSLACSGDGTVVGEIQNYSSEDWFATYPENKFPGTWIGNWTGQKKFYGMKNAADYVEKAATELRVCE